MADITLSIKLLDLNISVAANAFLKAHPNIETKDDPNYNPTGEPDEVIPQVPAFANTKAWAEEVLRRYFWRQIKVGHKKIHLELATLLEGRENYIE